MTPPAEIQCVWCAQQLHPTAVICWRCQRPVLLGCTRVVRAGQLCHVGEYIYGGPAIWAARGGWPVATYRTEDAAARQMDQWERASAQSRAGLIGLLIVLVVIAVGYVVFHTVHYHHCTISPGLFSWPSSCI